WISIVCAAALLPAARAQVADAKRGQELIQKSVQALGGDKFLTMEDRVEQGRAYSFYRDQISGLSLAKIYTRYTTVAPDKTGEEVGQREREAFDKQEDFCVMFNESGGWEITWRGAKELEKDRLERYRQTTLHDVLYIFRQRLHEPGMIFEYTGSDVFDNQPVDIVNITDSKDRVEMVYLHQSTHLPVRMEYSHINPQDHRPDKEVTLYSVYRDAGGGIQWPMQIRRDRNGDKVYQMFSESVSVNQDLTDDLFSLPTGNDNLVKKPKKKK
ncbi:MAG TPA: hypothetical protein VKS01_04105, partial [Bryobacteraceae bacterium]|nr:hypothetical protein [Bryobacteraceae bacterium]